MYYVYILKSELTGEYYKGLTDNVDRRLIEHNLGKSQSTKNRRPLRLIHVELCKTRDEARKVEKYFKSGYGREIIKELEAWVAESVDAQVSKTCDFKRS